MRHSLALAAFAACATTIPALGADDALTLHSALARAKAGSPQLAALAFELEAQDARAALARQQPATTADLTVEDAAGSGAYRGFGAAQTTLSLSRVLELGAQRGARTEAASAQGGLARRDQAIVELDVAAEVARRFVATAARQERLLVAQEAAVIAEKTHAAVEQRVRAAAAPEAERHRAKATMAETRLDLEDAEHALAVARQHLAASMGLAEPDFPAVVAPLLDTPGSAPLDDLLARIETSPDLLRYADEARLREAELRLARSHRAGDVRATLGVRRFEESAATALVAGVSLPLFTNLRAAPGIALAQAQGGQVASRRQAAFLKVRAHLVAQYQDMEHARHVTDALRDEVLPALAAALEQTEHAYRRGRYSYLELADAHRRLNEGRVRLIEAAADFHARRIEIERVTGQGLGATGGQP